MAETLLARLSVEQTQTWAPVRVNLRSQAVLPALKAGGCIDRHNAEHIRVGCGDADSEGGAGHSGAGNIL